MLSASRWPVNTCILGWASLHVAFLEDKSEALTSLHVPDGGSALG